MLPTQMKASGIRCKLYYIVSAILDNFFRTVRIPFVSPKHASIAKQVIEVDAELQAQAVKRALLTEDEILVAYVIHP